jgi:hypothetical protein
MHHLLFQIVKLQLFLDPAGVGSLPIETLFDKFTAAAKALRHRDATAEYTVSTSSY